LAADDFPESISPSDERLVPQLSQRPSLTPAVTTERELALADAMREFHTGESDGRGSE
jgi:hypothetical protein